jgi:hypothetical protein
LRERVGRPKTKGPKSGERDGGVCPEDAPCAQIRARRERRERRMVWRRVDVPEGPGRGVRKAVGKWSAGNPLLCSLCWKAS